jgi:hypothetical protein
MTRFAKVVATLVFCSCVIPAPAYAQEGSITGVVRDSQGGVLPGVTVEAASPALIEKSRVVTTDANGLYRIISLRPGIYAVTFTLPGFTGVRRENIELTGAFTATINAEMQIGAVQETITVTGESPIVDVQTVKQQRVLSNEVVSAIPSARTVQTLALLVPGVSTTGTHDVGGTALLGQQQYVVHGSNTNDYRVMVDGFLMGNAYQSFTGFQPNLGATQEVTVQTGAAQADQWSGGVQLNVTPKDGGNSFRGSVFANGSTSSWQSDNFTQRVKDRKLRTPNTLKRLNDINPSIGGPIVKDRLWFYGSARWIDTMSYAGNAFYNKNAGLKDVWTYDPDLNRKAFNHNFSRGGGGRVTWQVNDKNKFTAGFEYQKGCTCEEVGFGQSNFASTLNITPEAAAYSSYPHSWIAPVTWTSPVTNRLLLEAGFLGRSERNASNGPAPPDSGIFSPSWRTAQELDLIPVMDFGTGIAYHGVVPIVTAMYSDFVATVPQVRGAASYVAGGHAFKIGYTYLYNKSEATNTDNNYALRYIFFNGFPIQVMTVATPWDTHQRGSEAALYAQDRWTVKRLTMNLGLRFDQYKTWSEDTKFGPATLIPDRNFTIPGEDIYNLKDISPRAGVVYDVFGNGKTALRATANRYATGFSTAYWEGNAGSPLAGLVANTLVNLVTRSWSDANRNFKPDCDMANPAANGECGAGTASFGKPVISTQIDPETLKGWGNRGYNWEFNVGAQQELFPRVSVDVVYVKRVHGNFHVTDNRALAPSDYDRYSVVVPSDPRLPGGGGNVIDDLFDLNPAKTIGGIPVDNYRTFSDSYGKQRSHWNGVDVNLNARPGKLLLSGGFSTGRAFTDNCDVVTKLDNPSTLYCKSNNDFLTYIKGFAAYTLPKIDVQFAATLQSVPGPQITALRAYSLAEVAPRLGRNLSGNAQTVSINMVDPGTLFGERLNQVDLRFGKVLRFGRTRSAINLDLFNAFNRDTILGVSSNYATWQDAQTIIQGRIAKISAQFDF